MTGKILRYTIPGARSIKSILIMVLLFVAGLGFMLAGLSSYFHQNLLKVTDTKEIMFIPQGIVMLFYGVGALGFAFYNFLTIFLNIGSGYNEFSKEEKLVRIVRCGFPGKNQRIFLSYEFSSIKLLKFVLKGGLNPRSNLIMVLKDQREIPLFPAQILFSPIEMEAKAIELSNFLQIPLKSEKI